MLISVARKNSYYPAKMIVQNFIVNKKSGTKNFTNGKTDSIKTIKFVKLTADNP